MCLLEPMTFGEAKSTDSRAMGFWTDGRNFEKCVFQNPLLRTKSNKNGGGKNSRAFRLARTEPGVLGFYGWFRGSRETRRFGRKSNVRGEAGTGAGVLRAQIV